MNYVKIPLSLTYFLHVGDTITGAADLNSVNMPCQMATALLLNQ